MRQQSSSPLYGAVQHDQTGVTSHEAGMRTRLRGSPAQVAPQLQVIAVADTPLEVPNAAGAWFKLEPLLLPDACQLLRLHSPVVRNHVALLSQRDNMRILMTCRPYHAVLLHLMAMQHGNLAPLLLHSHGACQHAISPPHMPGHNLLRFGDALCATPRPLWSPWNSSRHGLVATPCCCGLRRAAQPVGRSCTLPGCAWRLQRSGCCPGAPAERAGNPGQVCHEN